MVIKNIFFNIFEFYFRGYYEKKFSTFINICFACLHFVPVSFSATVTGISYTPVKTQFLFETDGEWRTDGGSDYFHYKLEHFVGDKFVMYLDGNREDHFTCVYNEEENQLQFVNDDDPWDTLSANEVSFYDEQEQEHWDKGENSYTVDWGGKRYTVSVTVVDNPVESIYYETVNPVVLLQDCEDEWKYNQDYMPYFCYKYDMVQAGDTLFVTYTGGTQTMFTAYYDGAADTFYFESETAVQSVTIQPEDNGCFVFNDLEQGKYSIVVCGDAIVPFTLSQISVNETQILSLNKSENDEINNIQIAFGDVNGDSSIDLADISYVLQSGVYGSAQSGALDLDSNGTVDVGDIALILQSRNYGTHAKTLNMA